jgi:sentrin-specific protease 7
MYLNDSLIDLQIKLDIAESAIKDRVHAFNCLFIPKLTEQKKDNFSLVARWTKKVDLWSKDFVFVPINEDNHWSLIVVVRPGLCISPDTNKINNDYPCFLIMDSLGMHDPIKFTKIIKSYLVDEYMSRLTAGGITKLAPDEIEEISRRIHAIKYVKVQIPRQHNGYDCGVYVIKYLKYVLDVQPTSRHEDISTNFKDYFDGNHFNQDDIDAKREEMRKTISK